MHLSRQLERDKPNKGLLAGGSRASETKGTRGYGSNAINEMKKEGYDIRPEMLMVYHHII